MIIIIKNFNWINSANKVWFKLFVDSFFLIRVSLPFKMKSKCRIKPANEIERQTVWSESIFYLLSQNLLSLLLVRRKLRQLCNMNKVPPYINERIFCVIFHFISSFFHFTISISWIFKQSLKYKFLELSMILSENNMKRMIKMNFHCALFFIEKGSRKRIREIYLYPEWMKES